jgi:hypothetical protein
VAFGPGRIAPGSGWTPWLGDPSPGQPQVATLVDDFTSQDNSKWTYNGGAAVSGGQLVVPCDGTYSSYASSNQAYNLTNSSVHVQIVSVPALGNGTTEMIFQLRIKPFDNANQLMFDIAPSNQLIASYTRSGVQASGSSATFDATNHKYLRFRESGGTVYWETSPDQATWNNFWSATNPIPVTGLTVQFVAGYYGTETAPGSAVFDDVNTPPVGTSSAAERGSAVVGFATTGTASRVAPQSGTASVGTVGTSVERKLAPQLGAGMLGAVGSALDRKVGVERGVGVLGTAGSGLDRKVAKGLGTGALGTAGSGTLTKVAKGLGTGAAGSAGTASSASSPRSSAPGYSARPGPHSAARSPSRPASARSASPRPSRAPSPAP